MIRLYWKNILYSILYNFIYILFCCILDIEYRKGDNNMKVFNINSIIDSLVETVRESIEGYCGYDFVATTLNVNDLRDELYRPQTLDEEDVED